MKQFLITVIALFFMITVQAQSPILGARLGYGFNHFSSDTLTIQNTAGQDTFRIWLNNSSSTNYIGFFYRIPLGPVFIEIEPLLTAFDVPVKIQNLQDWNGGSILRKERFNSLDLSLVGGVRLWEFLRLQGGMTWQYVIRYRSEVGVFSPDYTSETEQFLQSYQAGIGFDIGSLTLDFNYEKSLNGIGQAMTFFGQDYNFDANRERFIIKLGIRLSNSN